MNAREFGHDLLTKLLNFTVESVPGAVGAGLSIAADAEGTVAPRSLAAVGVASALDPAQWANGEGPLWSTFRSGEVGVVPSAPDGVIAGNHAVPLPGPGPAGRQLFRLEQAEGLSTAELDAVRGAVFTPGEWGGGLPVVLSVYFDLRPGPTQVQEVDRHEAVLTHALAVVEYCAGEESLAQQMLHMTQYRRVIEQAKGLVMGATGSDAAMAFTTLARASQHFNVRLRNLAVALVEHVGNAAAEHPDDPELVVEPDTEDRAVAAKVWAALSTSRILPRTDPAP